MWFFAAAFAAIPVDLPPGEPSAAWVEVLALAGLVEAPPGGGAWVRIEAAGARWRVLVHEANGRERVVEVAPPATAADREDLAWLVASLAQPVDAPGAPRVPAQARVAPPVAPASSALRPAPSPAAPTRLAPTQPAPTQPGLRVADRADPSPAPSSAVPPDGAPAGPTATSGPTPSSSTAGSPAPGATAAGDPEAPAAPPAEARSTIAATPESPWGVSTPEPPPTASTAPASVPGVPAGSTGAWSERAADPVRPARAARPFRVGAGLALGVGARWRPEMEAQLSPSLAFTLRLPKGLSAGVAAEGWAPAGLLGLEVEDALARTLTGGAAAARIGWALPPPAADLSPAANGVRVTPAAWLEASLSNLHFLEGGREVRAAWTPGGGAVAALGFGAAGQPLAFGLELGGRCDLRAVQLLTPLSQATLAPCSLAASALLTYVVPPRPIRSLGSRHLEGT